MSCYYVALEFVFCLPPKGTEKIAMSISGKIYIDLGGVKSGKRFVRIHSDRRTDIARILIGKKPQDAINILPAIFSICACAHASAATLACQPYELEENQDLADYLIVQCENAREFLMRIFTSWGDRIGFGHDKIPYHIVLGLVEKMQIATTAQTKASASAIRQVADELDNFLKSYIFKMETQDWLTIKDDARLARWAEDTHTVAAGFILQLYKKNWQSIGSSQTRFLPEIPLVELSDRMLSNDGERFVNQPDWHGETFETGPFARNQDHRLIQNLVTKYGSGLLTRQVARLVELSKIPSRIKENLEQDQYQNSSKKVSGTGQVETARGQLTHTTKISDGKIADYKILAPTEWNFHTRGVVHDALENLQSESTAETEKLAGMIVESIDPCVDFEVRVQ